MPPVSGGSSWPMREGTRSRSPRSARRHVGPGRQRSRPGFPGRGQPLHRPGPGHSGGSCLLSHCLLAQRSATAATAGDGVEPGAAAASAPGMDALARMLSAALLAARTAVKRAAGPEGGPASARARCSHARAVPGYRVPDSMRALLEARDQYCGFPPCRRPAPACDLDHTTPYDQGGLTCPCNLYPHCRRHHQLKGLRTWRVTQPSPGQLAWRTPAGLTYRAGPAPHPW